jgi:lysyl-tRNA synthetase class 2
MMSFNYQRLEDLEKAGILPYPYRFDQTITAAEVHSTYSFLPPGHSEAQATLRVAGRVTALRRHRGLTFLDLEDQSGRIQGYLQSEVMGQTAFRFWENRLVMGDIVGIEGYPTRTQRGELSVMATDLQLLSPCLKKFPDKHRGVQDSGLTRSRRYVQLLAVPEARKQALKRARIFWLIQNFLHARAFTEVETPVMDRIYGGAEAQPFVTRCHALDQELYLRISPELYLKRLLVGGLERVFEISKQFRNEGLDSSHSPEFSSLEVYEAWADYFDMMVLVESLLVYLVRHLKDDTRLISHLGEGEHEIDLTPPFRRVPLVEVVQELTGHDLMSLTDSQARQVAAGLDMPVEETATMEEVLLEIFDRRVQPTLIQPTFVLDYPASLCPLTKRHRQDHRVAERFELFVDGVEIANAYSELNDPREQRQHFFTQQDRRQRGHEDAHLPDWDFVEALEWGMPPAGGLGIGLDRLVMLFTGASHIQDTILFPLRR